MTLLEMRQKRGELADRGKAILDRADREKRGLTTAERDEVAALHREAAELRVKIEARENQDELDRDLNRVVERRSGREDRGQSAERISGQLLTREQRMTDYVAQRGGIDREVLDLGLGGFLKAIVRGARNEVEERALGSSGSAGGYTIPSTLAADVIDRLRNRSVLFRAGATLIPHTEGNELTIASVTADATCAWHTENSAETPSDPTFGAIVFRPRTLIALVKASRELIADSANIGRALEAMFVGAMTQELDRACLFGSGGDEPSGIYNSGSLTSVSMGTNGATLGDYDKIVDLLQGLAEANAPTPTAFVMAPRTWGTLEKLVEATTNAPLAAPPAVAAIPRLVSNQVPITQTQGTASNASCILAGDWSTVLIGVRQEIRIDVLRERYADAHQVGFIAHARLDVGLEHAAAIGKLIGIIPA